CNGIAFRDSRSADIARTLVPSVRNVVVTADLAFLLPSSDLASVPPSNGDSDARWFLVSWRNYGEVLASGEERRAIANVSRWMARIADGIQIDSIVVANFANEVDSEANRYLADALANAMQARTSAASIELVNNAGLIQKLALVRG